MKQAPDGKVEELQLKVRGHKQFEHHVTFNPTRWLLWLVVLALLAGGGYYGAQWYREFTKPKRDLARSISNMERILKAIELYRADNDGNYPPVCVRDVKGNPSVSWRVLILPYFLDEAGEPIYRDIIEEFDVSKPWNHKDNERLVRLMPDVYHSPSSAMLLMEGKTNYLGIAHPDSVFPPGASCSPKEIKDPLNRTVQVIEVADESSVYWSEPEDFRFDPTAQGTCSPHFMFPGGLVCGFCDGHVEFVEVGQNPRETFSRDTPSETLVEQNPWTLPFLRSNGYSRVAPELEAIGD